MQPACLCPMTVFWHPASFDCQKMSELELFPFDNELDAPPQATCSKAHAGQAPGSKAPPSAGSKALPPRPGSTAEPQASARGWRPSRPVTHTTKPQSLISVHIHHRARHHIPHHLHTLRLLHPSLQSGNGLSQD